MILLQVKSMMFFMDLAEWTTIGLLLRRTLVLKEFYWALAKSQYT